MASVVEQQKQLDNLVSGMKREGYSFKVEPNWNGSRDVHALKSGSGQTLYATFAPTTVVWSDLTGEGTNGSKLPNGGEIDSKGAKYTLTVQCGGNGDRGTLDRVAGHACIPWGGQERSK